MGLLGAAFSMGFVTGPAIGGLLARPQDGAAGFLLPLLTAAGLRAWRPWGWCCSCARHGRPNT